MNLLGINVSEDSFDYFIRVGRISELRTALAGTNVVASQLILSIHNIEAIHSSETSVITRPSRSRNPEDAFFNEKRQSKLLFVGMK
jgi:hypothetical protein